MRRSWWVLLCAIFLFGTITVSAETYTECKDKCKVSDDRCNTCCAEKRTSAMNTCGMAAVKAVKKCRTAAKTDDANAACDTAFEAALRVCNDDKLPIAKYLCGVPTPSTKKPKT